MIESCIPLSNVANAGTFIGTLSKGVFLWYNRDMKTKHAGGRPPKYNNAEELEKQIDKYFKQAKSTYELDEAGRQVLKEFCQPTLTGLALYLGFESRQSYMTTKSTLSILT